MFLDRIQIFLEQLYFIFHYCSIPLIILTGPRKRKMSTKTKELKENIKDTRNDYENTPNKQIIWEDKYTTKRNTPTPPFKI